MSNPNVAPTPKQIRMGDEHRLKIANSNILNALLEHIQGEREMQGTQVTAALGLLKKVLPDLAVTQITGDPESPLIAEVRWTVVAPDRSA